MSALIHVAGPSMVVGTQLRQRCLWCGASLIDENMANVAVEVGQDAAFPTWQAGGLVAVDGHISQEVPHNPDDELPPGACAKLPLELTAT